MTPRRRLIFYTTSLSGGGGERVWAVLASALARRGHRVTFAVDFAAEENRPFLDERVDLVDLGSAHLRSLGALTGLVRRERPDLVFSALGGSDIKATLAGLVAGRPGRVVGSFHGYLANETGRFGRLHFAFARAITAASAATVCVSDGLRRSVVEEWGGRADKCVRIYNPIEVHGVVPDLDAAALAAHPPIVLAAGRLVAVKGFEDLLAAFALVRTPDARLVILGDGPDRSALLEQARALGVADRLDLPGYVVEPWSWFARARCFALSSRVEAFGNVVVEALAHGLPVVATPCDGPSEILNDPAFGRLVPIDDPAAWAAALDAALAGPGDPEPRRRRAEDFSVDRAADAYEALIDRLLG
ncbi:MAG: glycosyltransferase [Hyphomicrobiales bacterium]|nr:glycosyltransferase [Hyphomicrobiales bacterium]